ncbi:NAD-dependent epimerase/dehydratase family protein [Chloroflexota bacterium]
MILITGGLGFLGGNLGRHLLDLGKEVVLTIHRNAQVPDILTPYAGKGLQIAPMDVTNLPTILETMKKYRVTSIVHGAVIIEGKGNLYQAMEVNVAGCANILEAARLMDVGRVTFISSEGINQGRKDIAPLKEEEFFWVRSDRYTPATKKMAELLFFIYQKEYKMDMVITRPSRIYGPLYTAGRNPILRMVTAALKGEQNHLDFSDINETESHDFVYVRDCARAVALVHLAKKPKHDIYNIGLGRLHSFGDVARVLGEIFPGVHIELGKDVAAITKTEYDIQTCLDNSRIQEEFAYVPEYDLEKGLHALAAWLRDGSYL